MSVVWKVMSAFRWSPKISRRSARDAASGNVEMNCRYVPIGPSGGAQYRNLASICGQYEKVVGCAMVCGSRYDLGHQR
jgi:hypothetical protein